MESNETYPVGQGAALRIEVTLRDSDGDPITSFDGTQALASTVWPGGTRAASFTAATTWSDHTLGTIRIAISAAQTAALDPGRYQLLTRLTDSGTVVDAYGCTLDVLAFASTGTQPRTYCDYLWLLRFGRSWLRQLQTGDDEAGFAEQLGRARSWIEDLAHAHYRVASMAMGIGGQAMGPRISGGRSKWLQDQLDSDYLMVTDQVREAAAKKALALICEGQVGLGEQAGQYARLARMYHCQADYLGTCLTLCLDTNGDGFPDITIDCSCINAMHG